MYQELLEGFEWGKEGEDELHQQQQMILVVVEVTSPVLAIQGKVQIPVYLKV